MWLSISGKPMVVFAGSPSCVTNMSWFPTSFDHASLVGRAIVISPKLVRGLGGGWGKKY